MIKESVETLSFARQQVPHRFVRERVDVRRVGYPSFQYSVLVWRGQTFVVIVCPTSSRFISSPDAITGQLWGATFPGLLEVTLLKNRDSFITFLFRAEKWKVGVNKYWGENVIHNLNRGCDLEDKIMFVNPKLFYNSSDRYNFSIL